MNFIQNLQYFFTLAGAIGTFILGSIVLLKDSKKYQNISFFMFTVGLFIWAFAVLIHNITGILFWGRLIFLPVPLVIFSFWIFSYHFPVSKDKFFKNLFQSIVSIIGFPVLTILGSTPLILKDVTKTGNELTPIKGPLMDFYYGFSLVIILISLFDLLYKYFNSKKEERLRVQYFMFGLIITMLFLIIFLVLLPMISGSYQSGFSAPALTIVLVVSTSYSILKKRLWSLQYVIGEILFYILISFLGVGVYRIAMLVHDLYLRDIGIFLSFPIELMMGLLLGPLFMYFVDKGRFFLESKFSFRNWNYKLILDQINKISENEIALDELIKNVFGYLKKKLEIQNIGIVLWNELNKEEVYINENLDKEWLDKNNVSTFSSIAKVLNERFKNEAVVTIEELSLLLKESSDKGLLESLQESKYSLILKLSLQNDISGFIFWSAKADNQAFTKEDYDFLEDLSSILNLSIGRALLYEQMSKFNLKLKEEIASATYDLQIANKELKNLDEMKDDLISIASHELRTPATIVKGKLYLLKGRIEKMKDCKDYNPKVDEDIDVCLSAIEREIEQINTLLEASRIGKDTMVLDKQNYDITTLAKQAVDELGEMAKGKNLNLSFEIDPDVNGTVNIDVRRIREVIDNLITNAIKYTEQGSINLKVFNDNEKNVCLSVTDTGLGIPADKIEKLFSKFYRVRNDDKKTSLVKPGGTGLGLYVAKNIIEKHNGKIWVESEEGKGSIFTISLPPV